MAGCRPEYMPVLIAIIEAMCDPLYRVEDSRLDAGLGAGRHRQRPDRQGTRFQLRPGRDARRPPGQHQHRPLRAHVPAQHLRLPHSARRRRQGQHRADVFSSRWPKTKTARARSAGRPTPKTAASRRARTSSPCTAWSRSPHRCTAAATTRSTHVQQWADIIGGSFTYWAHTGFKTGLWSPLIIAGPSIAGVIAKEWSKDQVRQYLYEHIKVTAERATHYARMTSTPTFSFENLVKDGILPPCVHGIERPAAPGQRPHQARNGRNPRRRRSGAQPVARLHEQPRAGAADESQGCVAEELGEPARKQEKINQLRRGRPGGRLLSLGRPRESNQREGRPGETPPAGVPCVTQRAGRLRNSPLPLRDKGSDSPRRPLPSRLRYSASHKGSTLCRPFSE